MELTMIQTMKHIFYIIERKERRSANVTSLLLLLLLLLLSQVRKLLEYVGDIIGYYRYLYLSLSLNANIENTRMFFIVSTHSCNFTFCEQLPLHQPLFCLSEMCFFLDLV
mmetsp:Transcript_17421/g.22016  ORF Transcript_17421/g.22016 Transcript_17421/m.22016 type:complete len:110 (-) Transcript_17421:564-893(-)